VVARYGVPVDDRVTFEGKRLFAVTPGNLAVKLSVLKAKQIKGGGVVARDLAKHGRTPFVVAEKSAVKTKKWCLKLSTNISPRRV
jgi:ABC-type cobalamin/Fe3+-siderophores transport system ATPase subunit